MGSRPTLSIEGVLGQPGVHRETCLEKPKVKGGRKNSSSGQTAQEGPPGKPRSILSSTTPTHL